MLYHKVPLILTSKTPKIDLHGEIVSMIFSLLNEFIEDNYKMNNQIIRVVHGKSTNILTNEVHSILKKHKLVLEFKLNSWNVGETIVILKKCLK